MVIKVNSFRHCLHILIFRSNSPADIETLLESVCTAHNGKGLEQEAYKQKKHMHCQKNPFYLNLVNSNPHPLITKGKDIVVISLSTGNIKHFPTTRGKVLPPFFMNRAMTR